MQNEETPGVGPSSAAPPPAGAPSSAHEEIGREFAANAKDRDGPVYSDELPIIQWADGALPRVVDEAEEALLDSEIPVYQRGSILVRPVRRTATSTRDFERPAGALGIVTVDKPWLVETMTRSAHFERYDKRNDKWRPMNAPAEVAATYLARRGEWRVPPLLSVVSAPTLRPDGSVLQKPGYDPAMATLFDPCGVEFDDIPLRPSKDDAFDALTFLRKVFGTFPWVKEIGCSESVDESVHLAAVLQGLVRRSLDTAPMISYSATVMESGKSLLAGSVALVSNGVGPTIMRYPETNEEAAKLALSVLMQGESVVLLDNVDRPLEGDWLCIILTEEKYSGRVLGSLEIIEVPTNVTWLSTGNQLVISGDLRTRTLMCRIDPEMERPAERLFEVDLRDWIPKNRPKLVRAALTIMRAWAVHPDKALDIAELSITPWDRFKRWSNMVRAPLMWLGMADPCESLRFLEKEDPKRMTLVRLLLRWDKRFQANKKKAIEVIADFSDFALTYPNDPDVADYRELLHQVAADRGGNLHAMKLAAYLRANVGRIVNGMKLEKTGEENGTALWRVVRVPGGRASGT
jgi:putative DNA primase/helicase